VAYTFQSLGAQLWVSRWAGDTLAYVTGDAGLGAYRPRWSPNGLHLAYECGDPQTTSAIYTAGFDGSGLQRLTPNPLDAGRARRRPAI